MKVLKMETLSLQKKQREELGNDLIDLYKISKKFSDKIELVEGSIEDKLRNNELPEPEVKIYFNGWIKMPNTPVGCILMG